MASRWLLVSLPLVVGLVRCSAASSRLAALVRSRIAREAERRRLEIDVGGVQTGFFAVGLEMFGFGRRASRASRRGSTVRIQLGSTLSLKSVEAHGGAIVVEGDPDDVVTRLRDFRRSSDPVPS